jgi:hypothetical protein
MGVAMSKDSANPLRGTNTTMGRAAGLAGILLISAAWSVSANGAANSIADCADAYGSLQDLEAPTAELLIKLVDLPSDNSDLGLTENLEPAESSNDSSVPFLYLTPRVESMLSGVFDAESADSDEIIPDSQERSDAEAIGDSSFPPIAEGNADRSSLPGLEENEISKDDARAMPRFQHQMYRTDI